MSGTGYVIGPQIPQGLAMVVEGLAREILRHQPVDIYAFAAHHFEELMKLRDKGRLVEIVPQVSTLVDEMATIQKLTAQCPTRKTAKKQKDTTTGCGWSINRTVKVFRKHGFKRDDKKKQAEKKILDDYADIRSAGFSREMIRDRLVRSSSAGDLLGKCIRTEVGEDCSSRDRFLSKRYEYEKRLKRQKSAGQIERSEEFGRSQSVANDRGKWIEPDVEERTLRHRARTGSEESTLGKCRIERKQRESKSATNGRKERKKFEEKIRNSEETKTKKLKLRCEKNGGESKDDRVMEKEREGEGEGEREVEIKILDRELHHDLSQIDTLESLLVLPSVVTKQCSSKCSTNATLEPEEPADRSNFVLPPISNDSSKLLQRESNLTLPSLSNVKDSVEDIVSRKNSWLMHDRNESETENENENQDESETTRVSKEIENMEYSNSRETNIEEVFKDSLNVTPDSIEFSPRSDSLEHPQEEGPSKVVDEDAHTDRQEREKDEDQEQQNRSNELKEKLIEIEAMEKSIENTLLSSGAGVNVNNQEEEGFRVEFQADSNREARENDTISITEAKEEVSSRKESTEEEKLMKDRSAVEDGESSQTKDGQKVDTYKDETGKNSNVSSNISSGKDIDTDRFSFSENSPIKIEPSCYVLTEGSPCEIPESVTTVVIPDNGPSISREIIEFQRKTTDSDLCSERTDSSWNPATEEFQRDKDPFGDRVYPEDFRSSTSIDVDFLRGIRNPVDRTTVCQDLGNIKEEEEESERDHGQPEVSRVKLSDDVTSTISDDVKNRLDTIEVKTGNDQGRDRDADIGSKVNDGVEKCSDESGPYVPELNLDSLRDVTISSFGTTELKNMEDRWIKERINEQENEAVSFREGENTLSSFDTLPSEEKTMHDEEDFPSKNDALRERIVVTDHQTNNYYTDLRDDSLEEEIARELIKNLILETPVDQEGAEITKRKETDIDNVFEMKDNREREEEEKEEVREEKKEDERNIEESTCVIPKTPDRIAIELDNVLEKEKKEEKEEGAVEEVGNDSYTRDEAAAAMTIHCWKEARSLPQEPSEADTRQDRDDSSSALPLTPKHAQEEAEKNWTIQSGSNLWNNFRISEFHDSLPLPLLEARNIVSSKDFEASDDKEGITRDPGPEICSATESPTPPSALLYAIDLSTDSRSMGSKLSFVRSFFNVLPCLVRVEPVVDDSKNIADSNIDDLVREPLALDDQQPKPSIVIEEISVDDEETKQNSTRDRNDNEDNAVTIYKTNDRASIDDDQPSRNSLTRVSVFRLTDRDDIASQGREGGGERNGSE